MAVSGTSVNILETLSVRDPHNLTVPIGGAALVLQLEAAGARGVTTGDVDTVCPTSYFMELGQDAMHQEDAADVTISWPTGEMRLAGAARPTITVRPDLEIVPGQLPYSTSTAKGSPKLVERTYQDFIDDPDQLEIVAGIRCLNAAEVLRWKAILGRPKDLKTVYHLAPLALTLDVITEGEHATIIREREISLAARRQNRGGYYARIPQEAT